MRNVYAVSDIHAEYQENMQWCDALSSKDYSRDVLIVAGDVADSLEVFEEAMGKLVARFGLVFFTPGNHELWIRRDGTQGADSIEKLQKLDQACSRLGVLTTPQRVQLSCGVVLRVCPLLSIHHTSFDTEPDIPSLRLPGVKMAMTDFRACRFPEPLKLGSEELAELIDRFNIYGWRRSAAQSTFHEACARHRILDPRSCA